ncbi:hypothetical protein BDV95DRAFT_624669 [Massariosphaeria phaeospora]|uniref:PHD-type domain-containing protein n=1 Tax=Massariosphaeria phaeospora TaxID=100035 RepID=A0A7C8IFH4_9PLEO|nr:hypothetical protein BDV95DRAFT_624669 [Massariosphaeria phaeospora]
MAPSTLYLTISFLGVVIMAASAQLPIRVVTHNIRYATTSPFTGEKPWADRRPLLLNELHYNTVHNAESFICLQEVLHQQVVDVMAGLGAEWSYIGVGRDDGKEKGEYSPIIYRNKVWKVESWKTVWMSETPDRPGKGWDAASVRIVTGGVFQHQTSQKRVVGMSTHLDDQGQKSRTESAKLMLKVVKEMTQSSNGSTPLPVFLGGNLNSEPDGSAYQILNGADSSLQDAKGLSPRKVDYTLSNPDTLTKYKVAAQISEKVLKEVSGWCEEGANIVELCERGDKLLEEEVGKVYKGKKVAKGIGHCTTISPSAYITPYTPLKSDTEEAGTTLKAGECVKIQLGAQIDGFCTIVCDSIFVGAGDEISGREADLFLATHYANELLLRLMVPPGLVAQGDEEEQKKAAAKKAYTQTQITHMLEKVVQAYGCNLVESTTIWLFEHKEIEAKKKIILAPGEGVKGEGLPDVGEVWGVEMGVSLGSGKVKTIDNRTTLHRRTALTYGLKRPTSRALLSEVVKKFGTFPFSLRQLEDEKSAKVGVVECVRGGVLRSYEVVGDKNNDPVARLFTTIAITKNGMTRLAQPPARDLSKFKTDKKITDEEILKILEQPIGKTATKSKNRKKKKKPAKKAAAAEEAGEDEEESSDEDPLSLSFVEPGGHGPICGIANFSLEVASSLLPRNPIATAHPRHGELAPLGSFARGLLWPNAWYVLIEAPCAASPLTKLQFPSVAMPALRKRKSRTSTPYATPHDTPTHGAEPKKEKSQMSLDGWVEPAPQNPTASFEEHGFARHGVLETMAPLGVPPSSKMKQKARGLGEPSLRRSFFGRAGNAVLGEDAVSTPEMTPAPELERDDSERQDDDEMQGVFLPTQDEDEDDEYVPSKSKAKSAAAKTPVRGKTPAQGRTPNQVKTPVRNGTSRASTAAPSPAVQPQTAEQIDDASQQRMLIAANDAISRANNHGQKSLAVAIKELWEQSRTDSFLACSLNGVLRQNATPREIGNFRSFIKMVKKRVKRETRLQRERGESDAEDSPSIAISPHPPGKISSRAHPPPRHQPNQITLPSTAQVQSIVAAHPFTTAPALLAADSPSPPPAPRMPSKSPRKRATTNGHISPAIEMDATAAPPTATHTPAAKTPDSGVASDSDLSDVNEEIVQNGPPEPVQANGTVSASAAKKGKNAALARAAKKARTNSSKPGGKHEKKLPLTAEEIAEQEELYRKREAMADRQLSRMELHPPTSDIRFDDEMLETESLTESQIAIGPPVDANRPRRAGRAPRNSIGMGLQIGVSKRLRDDDSALPSPRRESVASTRPTTPAFPAPKRLKLNNGQAARTKRSPVKNRDGPIAGIPHTGGGARQSGPDDNDRGSPPSESDDLCAACKGAGEFVCCDNCPRVFHFLCCDPPRQQAPDGSFLCFECSTKLKPADEASAELAHLGPLFKQLEATNTRAFALPHSIQNHFEHVSAKKDGSYSEEIKKFPLSKSSGYGYQKPDYLKTIDGDHKPILCTSCGLSSGGKRQMLKCDYCHAYWHLDCCDPPLANPPHISLEAATRDAWKCPRHVDHDLRSGLVLQNDLDDVEMTDAPAGRLARKVRKPKRPEVVEPTFTRGMRNNGLIEIINDPDDDTDGEGNYVFGADESKDNNSKIYRVPEKGVILDFISKVKTGRIKKQQQARNDDNAVAARKHSMQYFAARSMEQQQAALHLAQFANKEADIGLTGVNVDSLVLSLTAEAPNAVVTASDAAPPAATDDERAQLLKLQELIRRRLTA